MGNREDKDSTRHTGATKGFATHGKPAHDAGPHPAAIQSGARPRLAPGRPQQASGHAALVAVHTYMGSPEPPKGPLGLGLMSRPVGGSKPPGTE